MATPRARLVSAFATFPLRGVDPTGLLEDALTQYGEQAMRRTPSPLDPPTVAEDR